MRSVLRVLVVVALLAFAGWRVSTSWAEAVEPGGASLTSVAAPGVGSMAPNDAGFVPEVEGPPPLDGEESEAKGDDPGAARELVVDAVRGPRRVMFELVDIDPAECQGVYSWTMTGAKTRHRALTGPRFEVPFELGLIQVEVLVPGYAVAERRGPFLANDEPNRLHMTRGGELIVDVVDERGAPLVGRHVWCMSATGDRRDAMVTCWAASDGSGRAHLHNVLSGNYSVFTDKVAEWRRANLSRVDVRGDGVTTCRLVVPVLDPQAYGGFVLRPSPGDPLADGPGAYRFRLEDGRRFRLDQVDGTLRCVVPGEPGQTFVGRIDWRDRDGVQLRTSMQSEPLTVVIGSMASAVPVWSEVK
ncbi:MAG: hypothetical protein H6835_03755 [Planctomycetes bacterium]|nr:hypothetical protein [Planctomycetota bacterium]